MDKLGEVDWRICAETRQILHGLISSTIAHSSEHGFPTGSSTRLTGCFYLVFITYPLLGLRYIISRPYKIKNIVNNQGKAFLRTPRLQDCKMPLRLSEVPGGDFHLVNRSSDVLPEKSVPASIALSCRVTKQPDCCRPDPDAAGQSLATGVSCPQKKKIVDKAGEVDLRICAQVCKKTSQKISSTIAHSSEQYFPTPRSTYINNCLYKVFCSYPQNVACYIISRLYKIKNIVDKQFLRKFSFGTGNLRQFRHSLPGWKLQTTPGENLKLCLRRSSGLSPLRFFRTTRQSSGDVQRFTTIRNPLKRPRQIPAGRTEKLHWRSRQKPVFVDKAGEVDLKICAETGKKSPPQKSFTIAHIVEQQFSTASQTYLFYCLLMNLSGYPQAGARYIISRLYKIKNLVNNNSCRPHTLTDVGGSVISPDHPLSEDRVQARRFSGMVWGMQQVIQQ